MLLLAGCQRDMGLERARRDAMRRAASAQASTNPNAPVPLSVSPSPTTSTVGSLLTVEVSTGAVSDLYGVALDLSYDPAVLEFLSAQSLNGYLKQASAYAKLKNGQPGTVVLAASKEGQVPGDAGQGGVMQVLFRAKAQGAGALAVADEALITSQGQRLPVQVGPIPAVTVR